MVSPIVCEQCRYVEWSHDIGMLRAASHPPDFERALVQGFRLSILALIAEEQGQPAD